MASIKLKGDTSGEVTISAPAVAGTTTLTLPATSSTLATQNALGVRNLIINGDMRIDQRNAGASVTQIDGGLFITDRFYNFGTVTSKFTSQQVSDAPDGFNYSLKNTSSSSYTVGSAEQFWVTQKIEGYNIAHLGWGTANAKTVTLSFWVKSSLTGTFGGSLTDINRSYVFSYTISSANTWEKKTITISGDTSGTWNATNGVGVAVYFSLGSGSTYQNTSGSWYSGNYKTATGATSVVGTSGATWYLTGVQLEVGDTATPFEHRPYDMELQRCQRYCVNLLAGTSDAYGVFMLGQNNAPTQVRGIITSPSQMRVSPSIEYGGSFQAQGGWGDRDVTAFSTTGRTGSQYMEIIIDTLTGLTGGNASQIRRKNDATAYFRLTAEL